jgi:RND superfamily putative drug exporter
VGGITAIFLDQDRATSSRLPIFIGVVVLLSFLLLMGVFRSVLVALKAAIMNLLSIAAAYGVLVMVTQWGWGKQLFGIHHTGPITNFIPMMMFAILFGLSMDYEVFLLSRIREEYLKTGDNALAVADGLAATARVITAAAAIMICVFLAFVLGDELAIKQIGLGLASAIFIDATLVRMVIVPSTMEILGNANWWLPKWLDPLIPHIGFESVRDADLEAELATVEAESNGDRRKRPLAAPGRRQQ